MEEDNGLDLTLSLPCGGPSTGTKGKSSSGSEVRVEETDRGSKLIDDFKNFLDGANHNKEDSTMGSQRSNQSKGDENLFYDLSKGSNNSTPNVDASSSERFWGKPKNDNRSSEAVEDRKQETGGKRKNMFDEINHQKAYLSGMHSKRTSHVSITTDEGSMAENEDVADSEADGSTSKREDSNVDLQGQRRFTISSDKDFKSGHVSHGVPFSGQSANILNMPYPLSVKDSNPNPNPNPVMGSGSNDRAGTQQPVISANLPLMFGYSSVQMPTVEAGKTEGLFSHLSQCNPSDLGRGPPNTNKQNDGFKIITQGGTQVNGLNPFERAKGEGKHGKEEGSSMHTEGDTKGINGIEQGRVTDGIPPEFPSIRPGISAELKFGGSGSSPNLPWVSTTAPNGKTISGVTYRYSGTQIRIVCACHGSHMSPEEFVQHATEPPPNPGGGGGGGGGGGLPTFSNGNPATSAQN